MSNKINLINLLNEIEDYVILKISKDFPDYFQGDDLDLLVLDKDRVIKRIYEFYKREIGYNGDLKITNTPSHCHIDFIFKGKLDIRIDLIDNFDFFSKIAIKPSFLFKIFKDRKKVIYYDKYVYVPNDEDDLTIRYIEYLEWIDRRNDKIKHLDFICDINDEKLKKLFFENTHDFIQIKRKVWDPETIRNRGKIENLKHFLYPFKQRLLKILITFRSYFNK